MVLCGRVESGAQYARIFVRYKGSRGSQADCKVGRCESQYKLANKLADDKRTIKTTYSDSHIRNVLDRPRLDSIPRVMLVSCRSEDLSPGCPSVTKLNFTRHLGDPQVLAINAERATEALRSPPALGAVALLDVEQPLLGAHDKESGDGSQKTDNGDNNPADRSVCRVKQSSARRSPTTNAKRAGRIFNLHNAKQNKLISWPA